MSRNVEGRVLRRRDWTALNRQRLSQARHVNPADGRQLVAEVEAWLQAGGVR